MEHLTSRNNTSFLKIIRETIKSLQTEAGDPLKFHQRVVSEYLAHYTEIRGLLAYWRMGSGKTILAASACEYIIQHQPQRAILFVSSKTLHANFVSDYLKLLRLLHPTDNRNDEELEDYITQHCALITLTANNMLVQVRRAVSSRMGLGTEFFEAEKLSAQIASLDLEQTFVIVDEAHNLFNGIANGSLNYVGLYRAILAARDIKLLFLTGSPIVNDPFEITFCFNMLNGFFGNQNHTLFSEDYEEFRKHFISHPEQASAEADVRDQQGRVVMPTIKNADKFTNRIVGLVSYYGIDESAAALFPKLERLIVLRVPMSSKQFAAYLDAREKEQAETKKHWRGHTRGLRKAEGPSSSYRVRSRQISNFLYPDHATEKTTDLHNHQRLIRIPSKLLDTDFDRDSLAVYSPKMLRLLLNVAAHLPDGILQDLKPPADQRPSAIGPGVIYSQFRDSGVNLIARLLTHYGMTDITESRGGGDESIELSDLDEPAELVKEVSESAEISNASLVRYPAGSFAVISGEVHPDVRARIVHLAMSPENVDASVLALLLITGTGSEGISTKNMRHVHAYEPFWHWARLDQVFARTARLGSHMDLPPEKRTVQPYLYLADYPKKTSKAEPQREDTTDVTLYIKAQQNRVLIDSFLRPIESISINCTGQRCRVCQPTGEPLFIEDLDQDLKYQSPCQALQESTIQARSILLEVAGERREYAYTMDAEGSWHVFAFYPDVRAYREIFADHPDYASIIEKLARTKK